MNLLRPLRVTVVATSSPVDDISKIHKAKDILLSKGFVWQEGVNSQNWANCSGLSVVNEELRADELISAYESGCDVIWSIRGGYGASKILPKLFGHELKDKLLIGYSDLTSLQYFIYQSRGIKSIHGVVLSQIGDDKYAEQSFDEIIKLLNGESISIEMEAINDFSCSMKGRVVGGNLSIMTSLLGTPYQIDTRDKIVIIEEVGEKPHKVDRMLLHMDFAGKFNQVKAVVFGDMVGVVPEYKKEIDQIIENFALNHDLPVFRANGIGHGRISHPFIQGGLYNIKENDGSYQLVNELKDVKEEESYEV